MTKQLYPTGQKITPLHQRAITTWPRTYTIKLQEQSMNKMAKASNTKGMSTLKKKKCRP